MDDTGPKGYSTDPVVRAGQLRAEGRFGGPQPGSGRPRVPRASEIAAQAAVEHAEEIIAALRAGTTTGSPEARARSAARWLAAAQRFEDHELRERRDEREADAFDLMTSEQILDAGTDIFVRLLREGKIDMEKLRALAQPEDVPDAVVVPDD